MIRIHRLSGRALFADDQITPMYLWAGPLRYHTSAPSISTRADAGAHIRGCQRRRGAAVTEPRLGRGSGRLEVKGTQVVGVERVVTLAPGGRTKSEEAGVVV